MGNRDLFIDRIRPVSAPQKIEMDLKKNQDSKNQEKSKFRKILEEKIKSNEMEK